MSVSTWGLTFFGAFSGVSALIQAAEDGLLRHVPVFNRVLLALPSKALDALGSPFGLFTGGYTGVLVAATAVPLWAKNVLLFGLLFLALALSSATAAITPVLSLLRDTNQQTLKRLERLDLVTLVAELGLMIAICTNMGPVIGRPFREGKLGMIHRWGVLGLGITAPLLLQIKGKLTGKTSWLEAGLSSAMVLVGRFFLRYLVVMGGRESADDPHAKPLSLQK
jgi:formate-dependent nitrite reductase membrane component NrfD